MRCLRQGAWGDHITLQAIADRLSVKISVLYRLTPGSEAVYYTGISPKLAPEGSKQLRGYPVPLKVGVNLFVA